MTSVSVGVLLGDSEGLFQTWSLTKSTCEVHEITFVMNLSPINNLIIKTSKVPSSDFGKVNGSVS